MRVYHWRQLTTAELAELASEATVAVLPLAAVEQHGPHLPLDTDVIIGEGIVDKALAQFEASGDESAAPVLVLSTQTVGASTEHENFAGTLSLPPETAIATIEAIGRAVWRAGIHRLVVFNSHGGNTAVLDIAALNLRARYGLHVVKATYFRFAAPADGFAADELGQDLHAGALETSMMLALAPESVRQERIPRHESTSRAPSGTVVAPEGEAPYAWLAEDFGTAGIAGNPEWAEAAIGYRLINHFAERLAAIIRDSAELG